VKNGENSAIDDTTSVPRGLQWSGFSKENSEIWTVDGVPLEFLTFVTNVEDGQTILAEGISNDPPTFRQGMQAGDVVDLFEASLRALQYSQVKASGLRPAKASTQPAFRFDYSAFDGHGLAKRGTVLGIVDNGGRLNLVIYEGAKQHYFDLYIKSVEAILASVELI